MNLLLDQMEMGKLDFCSITGLGQMEGVPHLRSSSSRPHIQGSHNNHPGEVRNEFMPFGKSTKKYLRIVAKLWLRSRSSR